jgi:hypothetical protein
LDPEPPPYPDPRLCFTAVRFSAFYRYLFCVLKAEQPPPGTDSEDETATTNRADQRAQRRQSRTSSRAEAKTRDSTESGRRITRNRSTAGSEVSATTPLEREAGSAIVGRRSSRKRSSATPLITAKAPPVSPVSQVRNVFFYHGHK